MRGASAEDGPVEILFVRPTLGDGGGERVTHTLLRELPRDRVRLCLALLKPEGELLASLPTDVRVISLGKVRLWGGILPLTRLLRTENPGVVVSTSNGTNIVAVLAHILAGSRARLVLSERSSLHRRDHRAKQFILLQLKRATYGRADIVTAVSAGVGEELVETIRVSRRRLAVVYSPVVTPEIPHLAQEKVDHPWFGETVPIVLACGQLVPVKDHANLLRAFELLTKSYRCDARLVILGKGRLRDQLERLSRELAIDDKVRFAGYDANPYKYMARCACFVLSSSREGLPGVLIQAMSLGAAVVATDCDHGPREIIEDGVTGFLCPVGDAPALAARMHTLLSDAQLRNRMGMAARQSAARYSVAESLPLYMDAILGHST